MILESQMVAGPVMQRYFFDIVGRSRAELDYRGRELPCAERALRLAELIALENAFNEERIGWSVSVSDATGWKYFIVPIPVLPELMAA